MSNPDMATLGKVLVVDDDAALSEMLTIVLRNEGFESRVCPTGERALADFREFRPDVVLLDLMLPGKDGIDALCGSGTITGNLLERGALVTGLDISPRMMEVFRERWPQCEAILGSILDTGLPDESFDAVTLWNVVEFVERPLEMLHDIHRLLVPGGLVFVRTPNDRFQLAAYRWRRRLA